ncbi:BTB/POZ domain-containing protein [Acanthamoeba polyphaga moumouvirus]|uniref:BTB/POZ domain-containing protein n=1 Tax=Acanthamoeba polyphaga moumouvirus TaxID=1269028 RepID=L7RDI6_9VIRU|nr:BTB/POZ domain-containing protein [Acanthamoeba polyphaga moumouvirus]AGC02351.1 BTB/POZ domain-containing protein [Acanthamoeba polyphaga moumouvirus]
MNNLKELYFSKKFSDLTLILIDAEKKIQLNVHKCVLYSFNEYFKTMLNNKFIESDKLIININVFNVQAAKIVIESIYGFNIPTNINWKLLLYIHQCCDYFLINKKFPEVIVPKNEFTDLLNMINIIGETSYLLDCIMINMPATFDLSNLSNDLLKTVSKKVFSYDLMFRSGNNIFLENTKLNETKKINLVSGGNDHFLETNYNHFIFTTHKEKLQNIVIIGNPVRFYDGERHTHIIKVLDVSKNLITSSNKLQLEGNAYCYSPIKMFAWMNDIVFLYEGKLYIYSIGFNNLTQIFKEFTNINNFYLPDWYDGLNSNYGFLITIVCNKKIYVMNYTTHNIINELETEISPIDCVCISSRLNQVVFKSYDQILAWNFKTGEKTLIKEHSVIKKLKYTYNNKYLVTANSEHVNIYESVSLNLVRKINFKSNKRHNLYLFDLLPNNNIICTKNKNIYVFDILTGELISESKKDFIMEKLHVIPHYELFRREIFM